MIFAKQGRSGIVLKDREKEVINMHEYQGKYKVTGPKIVLAALAVIVALALGGITTAGASGTGVDESVSLRLTSTGFTRASLKGFARLQLHQPDAVLRRSS